MPETFDIETLKIETLNTVEAAEILRKIGLSTSAQKLRAGISQGVYPFGDCVQMTNSEYTIYKKKFYDWIAERATNI